MFIEDILKDLDKNANKVAKNVICKTQSEPANAGIKNSKEIIEKIQSNKKDFDAKELYNEVFA